jgi:hypothetical protein
MTSFPSERAAYFVDIAIEGATDRFMGRPLSANPYSSRLCPHERASWERGWELGGWLLGVRSEAEARRWLNEGEAA